MKRNTSNTLFIVGLFLFITSFILFFIGPEIIQARYGTMSMQEKGEAGDNFSGTLSPVIAWVAAILTFAAFYIQYVANEQQKRYLQIQRFEDTFFRLLNNHQRIVESMDLRSIKDPTRIFSVGRDCFKRMYKQFLFKNDKLYAGDTNIKIVNQVYHLVQEHYKADLHHYFRFLYHILKFIKYSDIKEEEKYKYSSILRAALSPYELVFIFYNCLHEYGETHFKPLVEEFSFLKNLDFALLLNQNHRKEYNELAFASFEDRKVLFPKWKSGK